MHHKRKVHRNSRNVKTQQIRVALSHRPAVITESGGSSNWCQMLLPFPQKVTFSGSEFKSDHISVWHLR